MAQTLIGYGFFTINYIEFHVSCFFEMGIFLGHVIPATNNLTFLEDLFLPLHHWKITTKIFTTI
jgi:hypothetical protein